MKTLTIEQAAEFLHLHPDTLRARAAAGIIRGSKPGRRWVFREEDLNDYLNRTVPECSTAEKTPRTGTVDLRSVDEELDARLKQRTKSRPSYLSPVCVPANGHAPTPEREHGRKPAPAG